MDENSPSVPPALPPSSEAPSASASSEPIAASTAGPWGFWATVGWTLVIAVAVVFVHSVATGVYMVRSSGGRADKLPDVEAISSDGLALSLATILSAPLAVGLSLFFAWLRKGIPVRDYLGLRWPRARTIVRWCVTLLVFMAVSDTVTVLLGKPIVPEVLKEIYRRAQIVPLLWMAILVVGPIAEEFLFRGFLLTGLHHSRLGATAAVLLTSAAWAAIHQQYDLYGIGLIFLDGIILGAVRVKTGSTLLCILLHALMNFIATIEVVLSL